MEENESIENSENTEVDITENVENSEQLNQEELISKLNEDLAEQTKKADEYFDHLKRNMAEFDNYKKRMSKEKEMLYCFTSRFKRYYI